MSGEALWEGAAWAGQDKGSWAGRGGSGRKVPREGCPWEGCPRRQDWRREVGRPRGGETWGRPLQSPSQEVLVAWPGLPTLRGSKGTRVLSQMLGVGLIRLLIH